MSLSRSPKTLNLTAGAGAVEFPVVSTAGVDLGAVGRALGLDPSTVLLNSHYLSRGPDSVSAVTWSDLIGYFSARGFPVNPIAVTGRPVSSGSGDVLCFKRKLSLEEEGQSKKVCVAEGLQACSSVRNRTRNESLCLKRRVEIEGSGPSKRQNTASCKGKVILDDCSSKIKRKVEVEDHELYKMQNTGSNISHDGQVSSDGSVCIKGTLELENDNIFRKQNTSSSEIDIDDWKVTEHGQVSKKQKMQSNERYTLDGKVCGDSSLCIKRARELDGSDAFEKRDTASCNSGRRDVDLGGLRAIDGENHYGKRKAELEDSNLLKKHKITQCDTGIIANRDCSCSNERRVLILRATPLGIGNGECKPISIPVECTRGVDLAFVGTALGLDPMSVRINGHFISHGTELVSSVTWDSLLSFFQARGFPIGDSVQNAIEVQGKPLFVTGSDCQKDGTEQPFKRNAVLEDHNFSRKNITTEVDNVSKKVASYAQAGIDYRPRNHNKHSLEGSSLYKKSKTIPTSP